MGVDPTDGRPTYRQIADQLRDQIHSGELRPGDRLASERALADRYGVGPMTVRQATRALQHEGLLDAQPGRGLFVRQARPLIHLSAAFMTERQSWREALARQGHTGRQRIREVKVVTPPPEILAQLGLDDDEPALVRRRIMLIGEEPAQIADSYYPHRLVAGTPLARPEPVTAGMLRSLEDAGVALGHADERWSTRMPTPAEASLLRLRPGVPVLRVLLTLYDTSSAPVCVTDSVFAGDRHVLQFHTPITQPQPT